MSEPVTCLDCGMPGPPPERTCSLGRDHYVGADRGCPRCGRLVTACALRPCSAARAGGNEGSGK